MKYVNLLFLVLAIALLPFLNFALGDFEFRSFANILMILLASVLLANFIVAELHDKNKQKQAKALSNTNQNKYYYNSNDEQVGPLSKKELEELLGSNNISSSTLVWCEGMKNWEEVRYLL